MPAPIGNQFWVIRKRSGRQPLFKKPHTLWKLCLEYFEWVEQNPLEEEKVFCYQGEITRTTVKKMRAMTLNGLCLYLDIDFKTWKKYTQKEDFIHITTRAEEIIREHKFSGAAADLLNPNIIARDLGLKDKQEIEVRDAEPSEMTDEELEAAIRKD